MGTDKPPTDGHAVVVQFVPAAIFTHSQAFLIQHAQQADGTHLFLFVLYAVRKGSKTLSTKSFSSGLCTYQPESVVWQPHLITTERFPLLLIHRSTTVVSQAVLTVNASQCSNYKPYTHIDVKSTRNGFHYGTCTHMSLYSVLFILSYLPPLYPVDFFLKHLSKC